MINDPAKSRPTWTQFDVMVGSSVTPTHIDQSILRTLETAPSLRRLFWQDPSGMWVLRRCPLAGVRVWTSDDDFDLTLRMRNEFKIIGATISSVARLVRQHARTVPPPDSIHFEGLI